MNEFKAANGYIVRPCDNGGVEVGRPGYRDYTPPEATYALEEFFQAKHDRDAGRWRWAVNPHLVVYPVRDREAVLVVNESLGVAVTYTREQAADDGRKLVIDGQIDERERALSRFKPQWGMNAARAFFDAHGIPVSAPKPWEDAAAGEVWLLTVGGEEQPYIVERGRFESGGVGWLHRDSPVIGAGVRLWPAVTA